MALKINHVAGVIGCASMEEVILCHFIQCRGRRKRRDVSADPATSLIGADDHGHCVPANVALDATFHFPIARELHLICMMNRIDIRSIGGERQFHPASVSTLLQTDQQGFQMIFTVSMKDVFQRLVPFIEFFRSNPRNLTLKCLIRHSLPQR